MPPSPSGTAPTTAAADDFVIQLALDHGMLAAVQIEAARALVAGHGDFSTPAPRLLDVLIKQGAITSRRVAELLAAEFGMAMAPDLTTLRVTGDTLELVPRAVATRYHLLP